MLVFSAFLPPVALGEAPASYLDASVPTPDKMVKPAPAEGSVAATNPPSFVWLPEPDAASYTLQYSRRKDFGGDSTVTVDAIKMNMHHPAKTVRPGKWHWRYRAVGADGTASAWSSVRSFTVPKDAVEFVLPPIEEVLARIPQGRPRLFVRHEDLNAFRALRFGGRKEPWRELETIVESKRGLPLMPEPPRYPDDKRTPELWRKYFRDIRVMTSALEYLAFGYLASGEQEYADEAKRIVLHFCEWDAEGTSSLRYNGEVAMPIALSVSRAYDWIYDTLTPAERERIRTMMRVRGQQMYLRLKSLPYEAKPFSSHAARYLMFLGQASISFLGEIEESAEWFEYVTSIFCCIYPPWGGADGGYSEGPWYWSSYMARAFQFMGALQVAAGIDLHRKPFFRNTGWYVLYCVAPYNQMMPFGDGIWLKPGYAHKLNMYRLSSVHRNAYFRWYAESIEIPLRESWIMYLWRDDLVKAKSPADLPPSRAFPDVGLVAMHNQLHDGRENIMLLMRSSPYGAWSHSLADQNSFYIQAFGEALAIPTGYRPFYGDAHHTGWSWQTRAHNSILVNGEGQVTRSMSSQGRIAATLFSPQFDYACGDAVKAYGGKLTKFLRHVLFIRPDYFVVIDELGAKEPFTFDWLLHSWEKMAVEDQANRATISRGDARLLVEFVEPAKLAFSQTDQFTVPPDNNAANQWHLTASTTRPSRNANFVTVMYPYKAGAEASLPKIERIDAPGACGVSVTWGESGHIVVLNKFESPLAGLRIKSDAHIAALRETGGKLDAVFMLDGTFFGVGGDELLSASSPVTLAMESSNGRRSLVVKCAQAAELRLNVPEARPKALLGVTLGKHGRSPTTDDMRDARLFRGTVKVDGRRLSQPEFAFDYEAHTLTLKLSPGEHRVEIEAGVQGL